MTKTLNITPVENYLLFVATSSAPVEGTRLSDFPKLEAAKKLFQCDPFDGSRPVEVPNELLKYVRACWDALPVGRVPRTDDLPAAIDNVTKQLKE